VHRRYHIPGLDRDNRSHIRTGGGTKIMKRLRSVALWIAVNVPLGVLEDSRHGCSVSVLTRVITTIRFLKPERQLARDLTR
jgi:hypothetical protein